MFGCLWHFEHFKYDFVQKFFEKMGFCSFIGFDFVFLFVNEHEHGSDQGAIQHDLNGVRVIANKVREVHFLFHEPKKDFDVPPHFVDLCDDCRVQIPNIGDKRNGQPTFFDAVLDQP